MIARPDPLPRDTDFSEVEEVLIFEPQSGPGPQGRLSPCTVLKEYFALSEKKKISFLAFAKEFLANERAEGA